MASELRVNTLKDASGNNSVGMSTVAEGSAKAWVNFVGSSSGIPIGDSFNCSSLDDNGTGVYTPNWTNDMASANYSHTCNSENLSALSSASTHVAGSSKIFVMNDSGSLQDRLVTNGCTHGDLA